jgi:hypothetical protein
VRAIRSVVGHGVEGLGHLAPLLPGQHGQRHTPKKYLSLRRRPCPSPVCRRCPRDARVRARTRCRRDALRPRNLRKGLGTFITRSLSRISARRETIEGVERPAAPLHVLLRHRLLLKPGGFEGFLAGEVRVQSDELGVPHRPRLEDRHLGGYATGPPGSIELQRYEEAVSSVSDLLGLPVGVADDLADLLEPSPDAGARPRAGGKAPR